MRVQKIEQHTDPVKPFLADQEDRLSVTPSQPPQKTQPSPELLERAKSGDTHVLDELLMPHWEPVFRLAFRVTGHKEDAEDLAQEAFVRVIRNLSRFRGECAFKTWIYRIALNVCLTARRKPRQQSEDVETLSLMDPHPNPESAAMNRETQNQAREELERLHPSYREAVLLRVIGELSYEEIAEALQVTENTARLRVSRGMKQLRERMKPRLAGEGRR